MFFASTSSVPSDNPQTPLQKRIALTFDDSPMASKYFNHNVDKANALMSKLLCAGAPRVGFFAISSHINNLGDEELRVYESAGHVIFNHSHSHSGLSKSDTLQYIEDIKTADKILRQYNAFRPWYRFPYLDYGKNKQQSDQVFDALKRMGYKDGYVTISTHDWYANSLYHKYFKHWKSEEFSKKYVDMLAHRIEFQYYLQVRCNFMYPVNIVLLHANDINALFIGRVLERLKQKGWEIVDVETAYAENERYIQHHHTPKNRLMYHFNNVQTNMMQLNVLKQLFVPDALKEKSD